MVKLEDNGNIIITGHLLITDTETGEVLLSKSESSLVKETQNKGDKEQCETT